MSLIVSLYDYTPISRKSINGERLYQTPDGKSVPSVTTILDATKDKTGLLEWRKRVGEERANEITTEAAGRGTRMHKYLETYIETGEWPKAGSNPYAQQANKMAEVVRENALTDIDAIYGSEVPLYMPGIYAGTSDLICSYKGNLAIADFKQTNRPKKEEYVEDYYLQLVAYAEAHNEVFGTTINEGHIFMCSADFTYQQFDLTPDTYEEYRSKWYDRVYDYYDRRG